tara:strand:+ start:9344 stop:12985 length:3642 start_codon:yes stop_codon:yes gene_type:complete
MAITRIGTKLIKDGVVTTVKLGSSAITRSDIQSGSVQPGHLDVNQGQSGHVDFLDGDYFILGDKTKFDANADPVAGAHIRSFSFSQLKTALSLSNAARGNEGSVQFNNGTGFDGIAKITTDGVHLTASNAGRIAFAFTGISGSTGEIYSSAKTTLKVNAKSRLLLHSSGTVQGNQSGSLELVASGLVPTVKPAVAVQPGTYRMIFTSGSSGVHGESNRTKTYGPLKSGVAQLVFVQSTGSTNKEYYLFYLNQASSPSPLPISASLNLEYSDLKPGAFRKTTAVEAIAGVSDWRDVVANLATAMNTELNTAADLATVTYNATSSINGTASIEITYKAGTTLGNIGIGTGAETNSTGKGKFTTTLGSALYSPSYNPAPLEGSFSGFINSNDRKLAGEPDSSGGRVSIVVSGSAAVAANATWLNLGGGSNLYADTFVTVLSGSGTSQVHKATVDEIITGKLDLDSGTAIISGSGTASIHSLDVDEATIDGVAMTTVRDAAAYSISGSGTASIHKLDTDEGDFRKLIATVVTGATGQFHKIDGDEGDFRKLIATVVTSSGTSLFHKIDGDEGDFRKVVATNITSSGTSNLHVVSADEVSGSSGKFHKLVVDDLSARRIQSTITTTGYFEVPQKQFIPAVSASAGASTEGAGLQIGGTAGSGSTGVASIVLGDAGSGIGADLLFKIGATQGASLSGSVSEGGQRFGVTGSISGSVGVFHNVTIAKSMGNQDAIFSGSSFSAQTLSGTLAQIFDLDVNRGNINDVDGTSATFTTVSGTTVNATTVNADKMTAGDVDGTSMTFSGIVSGSTVDAHTIDVDKLEVRDLDFTSLSGSATATIHKVTTDVLSGSAVTLHNLDTDKLSINEIVTADVVKKANLNKDIVRSTTNAHGGLVFANGQTSVGWKRRIFSRSTKAIVNRTQPTQGSGSLYTTCSLPEIRMVSGSESVFFNGLLLARSNGVAGNPKDADYAIDYTHGGGLQPGQYKFMFTSGSTGKDGGTDKVYGPGGSGAAQFLEVKSSGSENYLFFLSDGVGTTEPFDNGLNIAYGDFGTESDLRQVRVESVSTITDWRTVVTNFYNAMNTSLPSALATVAVSGAGQISHTASITVTYAATGIEGGVSVGKGTYESLGSGVATHRLATAGASLVASQNSTHGTALANEQGNADSTKRAGDGSNSGVFVETVTSGSTSKVGTGVFIHEGLAMDSDDVLVVQYLSGSWQF